MRVEYIIVGILALALILFGLTAVGVIYLLSPGPTTTTTTTTTTSTSTTSTSTTIESTTTTSSITTSTTIIKELTIEIPEGQLYKEDDLIVTVLSGGETVREVIIVMDGNQEDETDSKGEAIISNLPKNEHTIEARKNGYETASINISVYPVTYANSPAVKVHKSEEERSLALAQGKVVVIFYDRPNCRYCMQMRPWFAEIVNKNRDCISYELLNFINRGTSEEVKELFPDKSSVATPVVQVKGINGRHLSAGFITKSSVENIIYGAASAGCPLE